MKKLFGLFLLIAILFLPIFSKFTITNGSTNDLVFVGGLKDFEDFDVDFTHSVNKTPVKEFYKIKDKGFNLYNLEDILALDLETRREAGLRADRL